MVTSNAGANVTRQIATRSHRKRIGGASLTYVLIAAVGLLIAYPLLLLLLMSINAGDTSRVFPDTYGLHAYAAIGEHLVWLRNSLVLAVPATVITTALGTVLAWILHRTGRRRRVWLETLINLPFAMGPLVASFAWIVLGTPQGGLINKAWSWLLGHDAVLFNAYSLTGIIFVEVMVMTPVAVLIIGAVMQRMDSAMEDSALMLGSGRLGVAFRITAPLALPAIVSAAIFIFASTMGSFAVPSVLGQPARFFVATTAIYQLFGMYPPNYALSAALGVVLLAITLLAVWAANRAMRSHIHATVTGRGMRTERRCLGRWQILADVIIYIYIALSFVIPMVVLAIASFQGADEVRFDPRTVDWTLENYRYVLWEFPTTKAAIGNSLVLGVATATICTIAAFVIAVAVNAGNGLPQRLLQQLTMAPQAVPRNIMALGTLWMVLSLPVPLYGTLGTVLIVFVIIYLPLAFQSVQGSLGAVHPDLPAAARIVGARQMRTLVTIVAPLVFPALIAAWLLTFMNSIREVSAAVFLSGPGVEVLGPSIISFWQSGGLGKTTALIIVQGLIIGASVLIMLIVTNRRSSL